MIQSIQAGTTALYNPTSNFIGSGKVSTDQKQTTAAAQNEDETVTVSAQGDTVTISNAGAQQAKTFTAKSTSVDDLLSADNGYTDATAAALSSAAADIGINEYTAVKNENSADAAAVSSGSGTDSSSTDSDLSEYSLSELKEMLESGEITQAEYNEEIQSRQQSDTSSDDESDSSTVAATNQTEA
jgi:hypothetical protein